MVAMCASITLLSRCHSSRAMPRLRSSASASSSGSSTARNDLRHADFAGAAAQRVATARAARAFNDAFAAHAAEDLLQVGQRNVLPRLIDARATGPAGARSARSMSALTAKRPLVLMRMTFSL
jgi:hypothetical protein